MRSPEAYDCASREYWLLTHDGIRGAGSSALD